MNDQLDLQKKDADISKLKIKQRLTEDKLSCYPVIVFAATQYRHNVPTTSGR